MTTLRVPASIHERGSEAWSHHWLDSAFLDEEWRKSGGGAIFHCQVKTIGRGEGKRAASRGQRARSATGAAAYRAGEKIKDERTGRVHDYSRREGVVESFILLPEGAPDEFMDRSTLWNAAEGAESRKDAVLAREWVIALPDALPASVRASLARNFAFGLVLEFGVGVDVAIHAPGPHGDQRNHHAHVMMTSRQIGPEGFGKKTRELDVKGSSSDLVKDIRGRWENAVNLELQEHAVPLRISADSFERLAKDASCIKNDNLARQLQSLTPSVHRGIEGERMQPPRGNAMTPAEVVDARREKLEARTRAFFSKQHSAADMQQEARHCDGEMKTIAELYPEHSEQRIKFDKMRIAVASTLQDRIEKQKDREQAQQVEKPAKDADSIMKQLLAAENEPDRLIDELFKEIWAGSDSEAVFKSSSRYMIHLLTERGPHDAASRLLTPDQLRDKISVRFEAELANGAQRSVRYTGEHFHVDYRLEPFIERYRVAEKAQHEAREVKREMDRQTREAEWSARRERERDDGLEM